MRVNHGKGSMALAHNGNLTNAAALRAALEQKGCIFHTTSDTEVIAYIVTNERLSSGSIEQAVAQAMPRLSGAFSLVLTSPQKLLAARDPMGFRPLCIGQSGNTFVVASETCALDAAGVRFLRDVAPGEIVVIDSGGLRSLTTNCGGHKKSLCSFELIYFSRPDSEVEGRSVHEARKTAGALLARQHPINADVVIGVPDSGIDAAIGYAQASGIPYAIGLVKNRYIGRTFIQPDQSSRRDGVRIKLNAVPSTVRGKRVIMVEDSVVRGTTCDRIVRLLRDAGAREVHMMVASPPFRHPCYFGTDVDSRENLIANNHSLSEIAEIFGADSVNYLAEEALEEMAGVPMGICKACFTGEYPVELPTQKDKLKFEQRINRQERFLCRARNICAILLASDKKMFCGMAQTTRRKSCGFRCVNTL
jgi:amidophosphoribosyltransferase